MKVDQNAERVVFKVRPDGKTDMIVQIASVRDRAGIGSGTFAS